MIMFLVEEERGKAHVRVGKRGEEGAFLCGWIEGGPPFLSINMYRSLVLSTYGLKLPSAF